MTFTVDWALKPNYLSSQTLTSCLQLFQETIKEKSESPVKGMVPPLCTCQYCPTFLNIANFVQPFTNINKDQLPALSTATVFSFAESYTNISTVWDSSPTMVSHHITPKCRSHVAKLPLFINSMNSDSNCVNINCMVLRRYLSWESCHWMVKDQIDNWFFTPNINKLQRATV